MFDFYLVKIFASKILDFVFVISYTLDFIISLILSYDVFIVTKNLGIMWIISKLFFMYISAVTIIALPILLICLVSINDSANFVHNPNLCNSLILKTISPKCTKKY